MKALRFGLVSLVMASATLAGQWYIEEVYDLGSSCTPTTLELDTNNQPFIAFLTQDNNLLLARREVDGWNIEVVDDEGPFELYVCLALDDLNRPHIVYFKWYPASDLRYAHWTGDEWLIETVDDGDVGPYCSIALDSLDRPHIAYLDWGSDILKYARWDGDEWLFECVDTECETGLWTSIALDSNDRPHISYRYDANEDLKYAYRDSSEWRVETVDAEGDTGHYPSIALDSRDRQHISYEYHTGIDTNLKYAYREDDETGWFVETVDTDSYPGGRSSIALDSADRPCISYYTYLNETTRYARWDGEGWQICDLDPHAMGDYTSLALDSSDLPHISYTGFGEAWYGLKYAWYEVFFHLLSPGKGDTIYEFPFTFDWEDHDLDGLDSYTLWWGTDPDFITYNEVADIGESEYTITGGIEDGARVYWRVKSLDDQGGEYWAEELDWYFDVDLGGGVDIVDFGAGATDEGVLVNWRLSGEEPFAVRVLRGDGEVEPVNVSGALPGSAERWLDTEVESGVQYCYWLEVTEADGTVSRFGPTEAVTVPGETFTLVLYAAYPSPSREVVNFVYSIPADGRVVLSVYDLSGRRVATLVNDELTAGRHEASWNCAEIPSGVYLYRLETNSGSLTQRLVVSR